jgi:trigger factor
MITKEKIKKLHYSVEGLINASEIQTKVDEILVEHSKKINIAGFRKGKVPLDVMRQKYGNAAMAEAADKALNEDVEKYLKGKGLRLAASPKADVAEFKPGQDLAYSLEFDVLPELPEIALSKYTLTKKITNISESEIEKALDNLRRSRAQAEKQDDNYKAVDGDTAVIDFKGFLNNEPFEGGEGKKHHLIIGSNSFIPGFEEKLIGHKVGDEFDIEVTFPKDYHAENLADKKTKFEIKIHELRHHILPELNDELAKSVGMESVAALREHIEKIMIDQYDEASKKEMREELLEILNDKIKLDLPESLVDQEVALTKDEAESQKKEFDEKKERADAERRVKLGLILAEWGNKNGVAIQSADLQKAIWAEASRYPDPKQVFEFYEKNPNALAMIRGMLFEQKALDAMIAQTQIKEKK